MKRSMFIRATAGVTAASSIGIPASRVPVWNDLLTQMPRIVYVGDAEAARVILAVARAGALVTTTTH